MDDDDRLDLSDEQLLAVPRPPCPRCGQGLLIPRLYGMPAGDALLFRQAERGEVELAGCLVPTGPLPAWRCRRCDALVAVDGTLVDEAQLFE